MKSENLKKKMTSKVAYLILMAEWIINSLQPRIDNLFYRFLYPMISGTISRSMVYADQG